MTRLHIFDMDGTLLSGSACLEVSRHLGQLDQINVIEKAWGRGEVGHAEFYKLCLPLWQGMTQQDVDQAFAATAWLEGIPDVWADIGRRREHSAVISLSPQFFVDRLLEWGVESVHGAPVHPAVPLDAELVLTPAHKLSIVDDLMRTYDLTEDDCVAYGDSASDIPLFQRHRHTVAVNGSEAIRRVAASSYDGRDLRGAYAAGRALLARTHASVVGSTDRST